MIHPEWSKNANIYEVNIRQYTSEGTIQAFCKHLKRLKEMDVTCATHNNALTIDPFYIDG